MKSSRQYRILYYFGETLGFMQKWQRLHFISEMESHGYEIEVFNPLIYADLEDANEECIKHLKLSAANFDLFMTCENDKTLFASTVDMVKRCGLPSLLICFDNLHAPFKHKIISPLFDLVWLTSKETEKYFKQWGCTTIFMPYAANPSNFKPSFEKEISSICFVGTPYGSRSEIINELTSNKLDISLFHNTIRRNRRKDMLNHRAMIESISQLIRFPIGRQILKGAFITKIIKGSNALDLMSPYLNNYPAVGFKHVSSVFSNHALALNILSLRNTYSLKHPVQKIHLRTFEISMSAGLQFASFNQELATYFESDKEIVFYSGKEEMISKARFYLKSSNESLRRSMKNAARKRAINEHTWMNRFSLIFEKL
jgi:spore maturation protein CgeB